MRGWWEGVGVRGWWEGVGVVRGGVVLIGYVCPVFKAFACLSTRLFLSLVHNTTDEGAIA